MIQLNLRSSTNCRYSLERGKSKRFSIKGKFCINFGIILYKVFFKVYSSQPFLEAWKQIHRVEMFQQELSEPGFLLSIRPRLNIYPRVRFSVFRRRRSYSSVLPSTWRHNLELRTQIKFGNKKKRHFPTYFGSFPFFHSKTKQLSIQKQFTRLPTSLPAPPLDKPLVAPLNNCAFVCYHLEQILKTFYK